MAILPQTPGLSPEELATELALLSLAEPRGAIVLRCAAGHLGLLVDPPDDPDDKLPWQPVGSTWSHDPAWLDELDPETDDAPSFNARNFPCPCGAPTSWQPAGVFKQAPDRWYDCHPLGRNPPK